MSIHPYQQGPFGPHLPKPSQDATPSRDVFGFPLPKPSQHVAPSRDVFGFPLPKPSHNATPSRDAFGFPILQKAPQDVTFSRDAFGFPVRKPPQDATPSRDAFGFPLRKPPPYPVNQPTNIQHQSYDHEAFISGISHWLQGLDITSKISGNDAQRPEELLPAKGSPMQECTPFLTPVPTRPPLSPMSIVQEGSGRQEQKESAQREDSSNTFLNSLTAESMKQTTQRRDYRIKNLKGAKIQQWLSGKETYPPADLGLINYIWDNSLSANEPYESSDSYFARLRLVELSCKAEIHNFASQRMFCFPQQGALHRSDRQPMHRSSVPLSSACASRVSTPKPDMLYGYDRQVSFPDSHNTTLTRIGEDGHANSTYCMSFPFLAVQFQGTDGDFWSTENELFGAAASCVNLMDGFYQKIGKPEGCSSVFAVAMSDSEARLFICFKRFGKYYLARVKSFLLQEDDQYGEFCRVTQSIIGWGAGARLDFIRQHLDTFEGKANATPSARAKRGRHTRVQRDSIHNCTRRGAGGKQW